MNLKTNILNAAFLASALLVAPAAAGIRGDHVATEQQTRAAGNAPIEGIRQLNPAAVEVLFTDGRRMTLDFYGPNIFRMFLDLQGGIVRDPAAEPEAQILVDEPRRNSTSGQPFRGRHRRHVQHAERFLAGIVFRQFQPEVAGLFGSVRRQGAAAGEQCILPAGHAAGDVGHDHAMAVDEVVCGLRLRDFAM